MSPQAGKKEEKALNRPGAAIGPDAHDAARIAGLAKDLGMEAEFRINSAGQVEEAVLTPPGAERKDPCLELKRERIQVEKIPAEKRQEVAKVLKEKGFIQAEIALRKLASQQTAPSTAGGQGKKT